MHIFTLKSFKLRIRHRKKSFVSFLNRIKRHPPRGLDNLAEKVNKDIWHEVDCLSCANCCKTMTPTYTLTDIRRISTYLGIPVAEMKKKWLKKDKDGDWINRSNPCQFLDPDTHFCKVYEVRPADCAGFPHLTKKKMVDYLHVHKQNIDSCPATFKMVERMMYLMEK